jgi:hypothetical protein
MNNNYIVKDSIIPQVNPINHSNMDQFGDFKSAQPEVVNVTQINKKLDDILLQISLLRNEIREIRQLNQLPYPGSPNLNQNLYRTNQTYPTYYPTPSYPGQPMPPYPHQQVVYGNSNSHFSK